MLYIYVIRHPKRTGYCLKNFQYHLCHCLIKFNKVVLQSLRTLYEKSSFSRDCILMIDEIYLQKSAQHQSGEYLAVDEEEICSKELLCLW